MTKTNQFSSQFHLLQSRVFKHACFWLAYYLCFSLIWASPTRGYYVSFYLEFVLMPLRILASYCIMYVLIPTFLSNRKLKTFILSYLGLIMVAGGLQMLVGHFFYDPLLGGRGEGFPLSGASWLRNIVLINSTVILLGAAKVIQLYFQLLDSRATQEQQRPAQSGSKEDDYIEVKSNRRIHRLRISDILYIEGMGNYITYVTVDRRKTVVYSSLKSAQAALPHFFVRLNRSYLVNRHHISAYDSDTVTVAFKTITRGKDISDKALQGE